MPTLQIENLPNDFKINLSELLSRIKPGEEIIILNQGVAIAKLVPISLSSKRIATLGQDRGKFLVPQDFNEPLPEEITEKLNSVYSQHSSDLDENIAMMQFRSLKGEET
ncbi:type II toxin-antitoxin system Phd/YefM family antitoxin [Hydrocoleum sp. CS-953]|uniref:type II toxin-antitoxin system Phd/YefM family antitoxin n=1 Tax=Hydrocoleum sp. CS-953 TaxID=1671698 RepID=UPI00117BBEB8|nr:type II toxin-antitoxin system Phd/YefM family antitoxin [Hydrocoleum sp. CS-953]